jgi:hypothetical protein
MSAFRSFASTELGRIEMHALIGEANLGRGANRVPPIAVAHHMIERAFKFNPEGPGHAAQSAKSVRLCQY